MEVCSDAEQRLITSFIRKVLRRDGLNPIATLRLDFPQARFWRSGLNQAEVAQQFGRDQSFVSKIEHGQQSATFVQVEKLASIYGQTLAEFWGDVSRLPSLKGTRSRRMF